MKKRIKFPNRRELTREELERYSRYAADLFSVLKTLRKYHDGVAIFGSRKFAKNSYYYKKARELGRKLAENGHLVITGGGPGVMEAANRGAFEAGGVTVGYNIDIPEEQTANGYLTESFKFNYFFSRKLMLISSSKIWVFFPGGFGTLDELFEVLTLIRDGKLPPEPVFLVGKEYWGKIDQLEKARVEHGVEFESSNLDLYTITDDIDEVVKMANRLLKPKK